MEDNNQNRNKRIYQYDARTGRLLTSFWSVQEAAEYLNTNTINIERACRGDLKLFGFCLSYALAVNFRRRGDKRKKQVFHFSKEGEFLNSFNSVAEAARRTQVNMTSIAKCCRGEYKSAGNYFWEYKSINWINDEGYSV